MWKHKTKKRGSGRTKNILSVLTCRSRRTKFWLGQTEHIFSFLISMSRCTKFGPGGPTLKNLFSCHVKEEVFPSSSLGLQWCLPHNKRTLTIYSTKFICRDSWQTKIKERGHQATLGFGTPWNIIPHKGNFLSQPSVTSLVFSTIQF